MATTALITGASSGIGEALARLHAEKRGNLVLVARRKARLDALKHDLEAAHGISVMVIAEDLSDPGAAQRIYDRVAQAHIEIDYLINNAGFGARGLFHEMPWADALSMIQVNAIGLAGLTRVFLPDMVARKSGKVLNVTSTAAELPGPLQAVYFASKAFAASLSNALVEELAETRVTVTNFMPTATATEFADVAGMAETSLFQNTTPAQNVARDGYQAMLRGDMDAYGGMRPTRWVMQQMLKRLPKRTAMRGVRRAQETA